MSLQRQDKYIKEKRLRLLPLLVGFPRGPGWGSERKEDVRDFCPLKFFCSWLCNLSGTESKPSLV